MAGDDLKSFKIGDLVKPASPAAPDNCMGIVLGAPRIAFDGRTEVVKVEWLGWKLQEDYATEYLRAVSRAKV